MCWRPLRILLREPSGLSCEIVSDLCPNPFSHDWHVQPSCQRPNRTPPKRREFSPGEPATRANPTVLETFQPYRAAENPVNACIPQNFHVISTVGIFGIADRRAKPRGLLIERATVWPSAPIALISAHAEAEDRKLRKELTFGGPCLEGTLQKPTLVSESSPVAGAIENSAFSTIFRCRDDTRDSKIRPAATHLLSVNCLYQGMRWSASKSSSQANNIGPDGAICKRTGQA